MNQLLVLTSSLEEIERRFGAVAPPRLEWGTKRIISPQNETLIITQQNPRLLSLSSFGMTPAWARQPMNLIHARAEGNKNPDNDPAYTGSRAIFMKSAYKKPLMTRRCVVIADALVECQAATGQSYLVYLRNNDHPFGIAGLYDIWINPGSGVEYHTFTIITVPGNPLYHILSVSRMPVIISKGKETDWLRSSNHLTEILRMLKIFPAEQMNAYPVSKEILIPGIPAVRIFKPVGNRIYQETGQKIIPHSHHYGHKQKGAGNSTWRGNSIP